MKKNNLRIVLGSNSPQRKKILSLFDFDFITDKANIDESNISHNLSPERYTSILAKKKGEKLLKRHPNSMIITADTIVYHEGKYLGKPKDQNRCFSMLKSLSGKTHLVGTSIAIHYRDQYFSGYDKTLVTIRELSEEQISDYINTFKPLDKAGGYAIQDGCGIITQKIEGNFHNVVGFEIKVLEKLFTQLGINLWKHLSKQVKL